MNKLCLSLSFTLSTRTTAGDSIVLVFHPIHTYYSWWQYCPRLSPYPHVLQLVTILSSSFTLSTRTTAGDNQNHNRKNTELYRDWHWDPRRWSGLCRQPDPQPGSDFSALLLARDPAPCIPHQMTSLCALCTRSADLSANTQWSQLQICRRLQFQDIKKKRKKSYCVLKDVQLPEFSTHFYNTRHNANWITELTGSISK